MDVIGGKALKTASYAVPWRRPFKAKERLWSWTWTIFDSFVCNNNVASSCLIRFDKALKYLQFLPSSSLIRDVLHLSLYFVYFQIHQRLFWPLYVQQIVFRLLNGSIRIREIDKTKLVYCFSKMRDLIVLLNSLEPYYVIFIATVGLFGNSVSFALFVFTRLRLKEVHIVLAVLAIADNGFLIILLLVTLKHFDVDLVNEYELGCKLSVFLPYLFGFLSIW